MVLKEERKGLEKKFFELCTQVVEELEYKLYDLEYIYGSYTLRVYIMNPETKTAVLDDCAAVDRALSPHIDTLEWMPSELTLEVSSPGIFRNLTSVEHFVGGVNERVQLTVFGKLNEYAKVDLPRSLKNSKKFIGVLKNADEQGILVDVEGNEIELKYSDIKKANLEPILEN
ncbi:PF02576 family protein [Bacteriovorax sp. BSW11_IV]|uniref:ribosome maturation factor RimP n=1 Tax=Bacteriovorax sp. BSW11_IV TaxID=1353529 RepID=UPI000389F68F|nr:ribosome maturation factor RimP [Bacteriovorax sp. BSW11_IV]EQC49400.1 PF02576 family protein [Bacteriovorax sp. BSW11_IV]